MAMVKCSECGKDISDKAAACIGCGAPIVLATTIESPQVAPSKDGATTLQSVCDAGRQTINRASIATKNLGGLAAKEMCDLNGDGKIDAEDFKIAAARAKQIASVATDEVAKLGKDVLKSDLVKDAASGAAVGAVIAVPVPILGPAAGAAIGAGLGVYKNLTKK